MNILVNGRSLTRPVTGVERYVREILSCLGNRVQVVRPKGDIQGLSGHTWEQFFLPRQVSGSSLLWSPANTGPLMVPNQVVTIHDLSPLEHPEWFRPSFAAWYRLFLPFLVRKVLRVITPSEYIRRKVIRQFRLPGDRVVAIPAGVNFNQFRRQIPAEQAGRYVLFVGSIEPRKNLVTLLTAWKQIERRHPDVSLIIAGGSGSVFREVHFSDGIERVHFTGYIPDEDLPNLYSGADLFVLPSWDEGFGLPVLEAMACGTPVIASNGGALPEIVGDAGFLFHPGDPAGLSEILSQLLSDIHLRRSLGERGQEHARQFSWQNTTGRVWQILKGAYGL